MQDTLGTTANKAHLLLAGHHHQCYNNGESQPQPDCQWSQCCYLYESTSPLHQRPTATK